MNVTHDIAARFAAKVDKRGPDECWPWTGCHGHRGYGHLRVGGPVRKATHVALHLDGRPRPGSLDAMHSCDNPKCVNPAHLRWGTRGENNADRHTKGRSAGGSQPGEIHPSVKLTEREVLEIRSSRDSSRLAAQRFHVSDSLIRMIRRRVIWQHI